MAQLGEDSDPIQTQEWLDALASVLSQDGQNRAQFIIDRLLAEAALLRVPSCSSALYPRPYCNTISVDEQPTFPGNIELEQKIEAIIRWNAIAMVMRAKKTVGGVGGHLASYASIATLYEVGLNHFFRAGTDTVPGDLIYFQGHSAEGNYARAFLEGRLSEKQLLNFRQEVGGEGISSYPHPWLMPTFWQFATVSLGLGPLQGIYQARFLKYLENRKLIAASDRKVWIFTGDGEMDEPESIAGLALAAREKLDNLIYVVNCNLQRLDGLVRGNSKIIQELEGVFLGAGWHVIKVLWGSLWDDLFAKDRQGLLLRRLARCVDGDLQSAYVRGGAYTRQFLCQGDIALEQLFADMSDEEMLLLGRGGHDVEKIFAAYSVAIKHTGQPTVILAQTVKGYGLGTTGAEGRNVAHNQLDMTESELKAFRDRFSLPLSDQQLQAYTFYKPADDSPEMQYLHAKRQQLQGYLPSRIARSLPLSVLPLSAFDTILQGTGERQASTTMILGRIINLLLKDATIGQRIVPIFSDEVRTFGMESLFRQIGIYSHTGQLYMPEDKEQLLYYRESQDGQLLEEGITEAGCMASWIAAATSYTTHQLPMIPFFTFYSMFGFQRVGDLIWAAGDMRARGFLIGATAGRTTLEGEGLQHQDGHSLLCAAALPNCRAYDPAFGYEMAVIIQHGLQCMYHEEQDVFYYIMAMNEKYVQPPMPKGVEEGIIKGMYLLKESESAAVQLLGSGAILREVLFAAALLEQDFAIKADVWSVTSFNELSREGNAVERLNRLNPEASPRISYMTQCLAPRRGPVIAATDYIRAYAEQVRPFVKNPYHVLGTNGFGRSDTRERLRTFFEVDRYASVVAALYGLAQQGDIAYAQVTAALQKYNIDAHKLDPVIC